MIKQASSKTSFKVLMAEWTAAGAHIGQRSRQPAGDVRCESRNCRGVEILRRALNTWKVFVDAVIGDADECDEHWSTRYMIKALNLFNNLTAKSVMLL